MLGFVPSLSLSFHLRPCVNALGISECKYILVPERTVMARFSEVFRCSGVDESPNVPGKSKDPGMVVPAGGSNIIALEDGERLRVHSENKHIKIEEIEDTAVIKLARLYLHFKLAWQDVDPQLRDSYMPHILSGNARFFKIHGKP
jgi:hypothetical protein